MVRTVTSMVAVCAMVSVRFRLMTMAVTVAVCVCVCTGLSLCAQAPHVERYGSDFPRC